MRVRLIHGLNISHKELIYLLQKLTSYQSNASWGDYEFKKMLVLKFVIPVACTYGEPLCDEVRA